jgi:hypothetical protein
MSSRVMNHVEGELVEFEHDRANAYRNLPHSHLYPAR